MLEIVLFVSIFIVSYAGIAFYRRWSLRKGIVDRPNERSLHAEPTPRGGGLVIAAACVSGYFIATYLGAEQLSWTYVIGSVIIVAISWIDDLRSVPSIVRFLVHAAAASLVVAGNGSLQAFNGATDSTLTAYLATVCTVVWIVWLVNAYNFMDGIDGIAGAQALIAGLAWFVIASAGSAAGIYYYGLVVAASSLGFLIHNWQPARIFMGDAGSAFLGFSFAVVPLLASTHTAEFADLFALAGVVFVWLFVFDSMLTLFWRLFTGQRIWTAHREHLYQRLVRSGLSHSTVAIVYSGLSAIISLVFIIFYVFLGTGYPLPLFIIIVLSCLLTVEARRRKLLV